MSSSWTCCAVDLTDNVYGKRQRTLGTKTKETCEAGPNQQKDKRLGKGTKAAYYNYNLIRRKYYLHKQQKFAAFWHSTSYSANHIAD